jgi:hypothetical protein
LHDSDPLYSGKNADPTEKEENYGGIDCRMRIPDQRKI